MLNIRYRITNVTVIWVAVIDSLAIEATVILLDDANCLSIVVFVT